MLPSPLAIAAVVAAFGIPLVSAGSYAAPYIPATYDYIVVGGGTSGLALASRLAANATVSVAVVEAGGLYQVDDALLDIPGFGALQATGSDKTDLNALIDWDFVTEPMQVRLEIFLCPLSFSLILICLGGGDGDPPKYKYVLIVGLFGRSGAW